MNGAVPATGLELPADILARAVGSAIWVIGDIMLDEYAVGKVERISPEAPVPVLHVARVSHHLGGAANVALQAATLGAAVRLGGAVGHDAAGHEVLRLCEASGIDVRAVARLRGCQTTRKLRALAQNQQLVRLDWEDAAACPADAIQRVLQELASGCPPAIIVLSDYAKGVLADAVLATVASLAQRTGAQVIVDPKRSDFSKYPPHSILKPNLRELERAAGKALDPTDTTAIREAAKTAMAAADARAMVVTRGAHGLLVITADGGCRAIPAHGRALADTIGAGDTVVAVLAVALAAGASLGDAAHLANTAAGITVGRVGTNAVKPAEITARIHGANVRKLLDRDALTERVRGWRHAGKRVVLTNGCFDLLHAGHLALLHQAAQYGDVLIVAINSDASIRRLKGPQRPVVPAPERAALLAALECVDVVTVFDEETPLALLEAVRPDVLVKGEDYPLDRIVGRELVESGGGVVLRVPLLPDHSTTGVVARLAALHGAAP